MTRFRDHLMSLMVSSLRPVHWIMGFCGLVAFGGVYAAHTAQIWNPTDRLQNALTLETVLAAFLLYSILSFINAIVHSNTAISIGLRWLSSLLGATLWIACLASSFYWVMGEINLKDGMNLLYCIPLTSDMWVLAQLMAGIDKIERRLYV